MVDKPKNKRPAKSLLLRPKKMHNMLEKVTQEMYKRNLELDQANKTLSLLRTIDSIVLESHEELEVLCQNIASAIVKHSNYPLVAVLASPPHKNYLELMGFSTSTGVEIGIGECKIKRDSHEQWMTSPEQKLVVDLNKAGNDVIADTLCVTKKQIDAIRESTALDTVVMTKLVARHRLVGLLVIGMPQSQDVATEKGQLLVDRLTEVVGIALDSKLLFEENQLVLRQLQNSNEKLKAMDETKDEFISMASHQLRTPLTSVKGYISMVLEGDVGKIDAAQRKLLDQAFISSQRMVYLIADLLNVSRLRTGKFIIEAKETNLADVVEGEISQLKETAESRNLTLVFKKPKNFPSLMLDETKIRQVIMNFVDNAIYYTPAGGTITVDLSEVGNSIEFRVIDDGIGVPKSEQLHMFSKFYRAGNAKKARPDGTGLGLFMAKKVIVAQGGSTIFNSQEGKGSVFGFSFNKSKLQISSDKAQEPGKTSQ